MESDQDSALDVRASGKNTCYLLRKVVQLIRRQSPAPAFGNKNLINNCWHYEVGTCQAKNRAKRREAREGRERRKACTLQI
ncbi:hypothetical protein GOBAR_DD32723 [Gossypium barbadense]|nr:hypothetical protein GOBAR_DD32723 [Gossypium barbadense]